ncbi:MAG: galactokinase [Deltaproteobacteria bacterium]|nr:galactokinase [Deltaproteobacteria bacterium]
MRAERLGEFRSHFGGLPEVDARAPGRVNLIGEHTDYNGGLVLPCAIDLDTRVLLRARADGTVRVFSREFREEQSFEASAPALRGGWVDYVQGVFAALREHGVTAGGFDIAIESDVPPGAGLSSSAALELALLTAIDRRLELGLAPERRCELAHVAEVSFVGVPCGIMDQWAVGLARRDTLLRIDCHTRSVRRVAFPSECVALLIADSGVRRALSQGGLAKRSSECAEVLEIARRAGALSAAASGLCALDPEALAELAPLLSPQLRRRARHVTSENRRVEATCDALEAGDFDAAGEALREGMRSLREDFEVSTPELDHLCASGDAAPGVYGSRLTGAGFGGCSIHLVEPRSACDAADFIASGFESEFGRRPRIQLVSPADGASATTMPG